MSLKEIQARDAQAQAEIDAILSRKPLTYSFFSERIHAFVMRKFLLNRADLNSSDDLTELATISLSKTMKLSPELIAEYQAGENCEGATSTDVKRTLLIVKIQKSLGVKLTLEELMRVKTVEDLTRELWPHLDVEREPTETDEAAAGSSGDNSSGESSIDKQQDDIVRRFQSIGDPLSQYEYLIEFASKLEPMDENSKTDENLVKGCQSKAWLSLENRDGFLRMQAASDTLIIRGVLYLLREVLDGKPLQDVAAATIYFPEKADIVATFSSSRRSGVKSLIATIQDFARKQVES